MSNSIKKSKIAIKSNVNQYIYLDIKNNYKYTDKMSKINAKEFNRVLIQTLLDNEKKNNDQLQVENKILRESLEYYKQLYMSKSSEDDQDMGYQMAYRKKLRIYQNK